MGNDARTRAPRLSQPPLSRATRADLPEVTALEKVCYGDPWPDSAFASLPDNSRVYFAVARDEAGRVAGYVVAWFVVHEGELANLAVAPDQRRKGIARTLLDAMLNDATGRGVSEVYLEVRESNLAARHLYASRGFQEVGRRRRYYRTPEEDALILRLTLGG